jgi:diguanylate cyclase (GGDEF)-like protein
MFGFHQFSKRQEAKRMAAGAAAESRQLLDRTHELEQLSRCSQGLAQALSLDSLRIAVLRYVPDLLGDADAWLLGVSEGKWETLADTRFNTEIWWEGHLPHLVESVDHLADPPVPFLFESWWCYPLVAHDSIVGILGLHTRGEQPPTRVERLTEALAAVLAVAIRNVQLFAQMRSESARDPLTGCLRRSPAIEVLRTELVRSRRNGNPVSVIMFDLDGFKLLNDAQGHACGDIALSGIGTLLRHHLRNSDTKCRYGGDEFLVILPETPDGGAQQVAQNLRRAISEMPVQWGEHMLGVTASVGVVTHGTGQVSAEELVAQADAALYAAKRAGRNCVQIGASGATTLSPVLMGPEVEAVSFEPLTATTHWIQEGPPH